MRTRDGRQTSHVGLAPAPWRDCGFPRAKVEKQLLPSGAECVSLLAKHLSLHEIAMPGVVPYLTRKGVDR